MVASTIHELATTNTRQTKAEIRKSASSQPLFEFDLSFCTKDYSSNPKEHSVVMRAPGSGVVGTADITFSSSSTPIHICFGDGSVDSQTAVWEDIHCRSKWKMPGFELSINLGGSLGRKIFHWKRTHDVGDAVVTTRKLDWLHLEFVEVDTGMVVARFAHHFKYGSKRGDFELLEYGGSNWEMIVILSGTAVLEYMRKVSGWSC